MKIKKIPPLLPSLLLALAISPNSSYAQSASDRVIILCEAKRSQKTLLIEQITGLDALDIIKNVKMFNNPKDEYRLTIIDGAYRDSSITSASFAEQHVNMEGDDPRIIERYDGKGHFWIFAFGFWYQAFNGGESKKVKFAFYLKEQDTAMLDYVQNDTFVDDEMYLCELPMIKNVRGEVHKPGYIQLSVE